jgi:hypothetical protein
VRSGAAARCSLPHECADNPDSGWVLQTTANFGTPFQLDNPIFGELDTGTLGGVQLVDVTDQGESITITRGRNRETEQFNAGTATVVLMIPSASLTP